MSGAALRREDALRARSRSWRDRARRAEEAAAEALAMTSQPYVAFSGGKDSLVVLAIAARVRPGIAAIWSDDELEYPEQPTYIPRAARAVGAELVICSGYARHAGWFWPWRDEPFWREPDPATIWVREMMDTWSVRHGYDLCLLGLRKAESSYRRIALSRFGSHYQHRTGQWRCHPLAGWDEIDVWAAIGEWGLPYSPAYDIMARIGVPRERQRIGPLPLSPAWVLDGGWPDLYRKLTARYGYRWSGAVAEGGP